MPQAQLQPQPLPPQIKKIITDIERSSKIDIQQVIQKIDHLFDSAAKKIFGEKTVEKILQNPNNQDSKDLISACAMFLAFKTKMLMILAAAWALLVKRLPILILRKYAGSVVETTLAALTAALMWAQKHQAEAAQTGKSSVFSNILETLIKFVSLCMVHIGKMAEIRSDLTAAYMVHHTGATAAQAENVFDSMIRETRAHLNLGALTTLISQIISRAAVETLSENIVMEMLTAAPSKGMSMLDHFIEHIDNYKTYIATTMGISITSPEVTAHAESLIHHVAMSLTNDAANKRVETEYRQNPGLAERVAAETQNYHTPTPIPPVH